MDDDWRTAAAAWSSRVPTSVTATVAAAAAFLPEPPRTVRRSATVAAFVDRPRNITHAVYARVPLPASPSFAARVPPTCLHVVPYIAIAIMFFTGGVCCCCRPAAAVAAAHVFVLLVASVVSPLPGVRAQAEDIPHNEVKNWALKFGVDLWEFGRQITNMNEIQKKYRERESKVRRKDGLLLIRDLAAEVKNMMDIKMNSVLKRKTRAKWQKLKFPIDKIKLNQLSNQPEK
ncbi:Hypothetical protein CINCED_3A009813, partial [Cinara cedri]